MRREVKETKEREERTEEKEKKRTEKLLFFLNFFFSQMGILSVGLLSVMETA